MVSQSVAHAVLALLFTASAAAQPLPQADEVRAGYQRLYSGDTERAYNYFTEVRARDSQSLPIWFGQIFALQARIELDESLSPSFEREIAAFIARADERYSRSRTDSEALFYLAQAYLLRSRYRIEYDKGIWGAARDAAKSKGFADQYLKQHPEHGDAYLVAGLYNYYVDIAPNFVKVLRVLLFLPSGNRAEGLKQLERAGREGDLFAPLAGIALADIYSSLEGRLPEAIVIGQRLVQRFPQNADLQLELAAMYAHPTVEAYERAVQQYTAVIDATKGSTLQQVADHHRATLGLSNLRRTQWRLDEATDLLTVVIDQNVQKPAWIMPSFLLRRANFRMLLNDPTAIDDARRVLADAKMSNWHDAAKRQIAAIESRRRSNEGALYAVLIPGNRLVVEHRWDEARAHYDRAAATAPGDWQVRYRLAYLEFARGNYDAAANGFEPIVASSARMPAWLRATAMLNLAWTHDLAGRRAEALKLYKRVIDQYENEGAAGAARVGLITPYRGPVQISEGSRVSAPGDS